MEEIEFEILKKKFYAFLVLHGVLFDFIQAGTWINPKTHKVDKNLDTYLAQEKPVFWANNWLVWGDTKQGYAYWADLNEEWKDMIK